MATESGLGYPIHTPKSLTSGRKSGQPTVIVMHTTEGSEGPASAEDGAAYDARRTDGTSTHFFVDSNSVVQCVYTTDEAHAARAHGNDVGIQIEICGKAGQGASGWADAVSKATLENVAQLCVKLRAKYPSRFPLTHLTPAGLRAGMRGFVGHVDCTKAWPEDGGTHTDPGPNFPWSSLLARISQLEEIMADVTLSATTKQDIANATVDALGSRDGVFRSPSWRSVAQAANTEWPFEDVFTYAMEDTHARLVGLDDRLNPIALDVASIKSTLASMTLDNDEGGNAFINAIADAVVAKLNASRSA